MRSASTLVILAATVAAISGSVHTGGEAVRGDAPSAECSVLQPQVWQSKTNPRRQGVDGGRSSKLAGYEYPADRKGPRIKAERPVDGSFKWSRAIIMGHSHDARDEDGTKALTCRRVTTRSPAPFRTTAWRNRI